MRRGPDLPLRGGHDANPYPSFRHSPLSISERPHTAGAVVGREDRRFRHARRRRRQVRGGAECLPPDLRAQSRYKSSR